MAQDFYKEEEIGGHMFKIYMLPPRIAMATLTELGKMFGPAYAEMFSEKDDDNFSKATKLLFDNIDNPKLNAIMDKMAEKTLVDDKPLKNNFDLIFLGKIGLMMRWFVFAVRSQFSDFLGELTGVLAGLGQKDEPKQP